jgi:hypothetical protein
LLILEGFLADLADELYILKGTQVETGGDNAELVEALDALRALFPVSINIIVKKKVSKLLPLVHPLTP